MTRLLALVGPTASGKSRMAVDVALRLAERADSAVEIVSCDSMAVYRGIDVAVAKPSAAERGGVAHHLLDVFEATEEVTAVAYRDLAREVIGDIAARGALPMLVGGSGLWYRAVVDPLAFAPTSDVVRRRLEGSDPQALYRRLREADPATAERLDPRNVRRVVRAVEILELTGRPPSELRSDWKRRGDAYDLRVAGLTWDMEALHERIEERVRGMLAAGLVEEVRGLLQRPVSRTARQAIGVKEVMAHLAGEATLDETGAEIVRNTKRFVRRQLSWFRTDERIVWVNVSEVGWDAAREEILGRFS